MCRRSVRLRPRAIVARRALRLFSLDARLLRVLHAEDAHTPANARRSVVSSIEIALDDFDALARQRRCPLAVRSSRQATQMEPGALQSLRNRAALIAREPFDRLSWPVS